MGWPRPGKARAKTGSPPSYKPAPANLRISSWRPRWCPGSCALWFERLFVEDGSSGQRVTTFANDVKAARLSLHPHQSRDDAYMAVRVTQDHSRRVQSGNGTQEVWL